MKGLLPDRTRISQVHLRTTRLGRALDFYSGATRDDLAHAYRRVVKAGYPVAGASDHGVSEAIYLSDPDGNGGELYTDRPRSLWRWQNGQIAMVTTPLDLENLLTTIAAKPSTTNQLPHADLGHIYLHVKDLADAERFYSEFLGLALMQRSYPRVIDASDFISVNQRAIE